MKVELMLNDQSSIFNTIQFRGEKQVDCASAE